MSAFINHRGLAAAMIGLLAAPAAAIHDAIAIRDRPEQAPEFGGRGRGKVRSSPRPSGAAAAKRAARRRRNIAKHPRCAR